MKKPKLIGVITSNDNSVISDLLFLLLKGYGFKVALLNNEFRIFNENEKKISSCIKKEFEKLFSNESDLDYIIFDNLQEKYLSEMTNRLKFDAVIDDTPIENNKNDENIISKKMIFNNLKTNGISIINSDNKRVNDYFNTLRDKIIISYGLNTKSTITASSLDIDENISFICCIQRGITTVNGNEIEQMEFPIKAKLFDSFNVSDFLATIGLVLIYEIPINKIQEMIYMFESNSYY